MEQEKIKKILPQRYPFLFIDKVLEFEKNKKHVLKSINIKAVFIIFILRYYLKIINYFRVCVS